jgi:hypothetical protein
MATTIACSLLNAVSAAVTRLDFVLPASTDCGWRCSGVLYVHSPGQPAGAATCPYTSPYPLIVFVSGFLVRLQLHCLLVANLGMLPGNELLLHCWLLTSSDSRHMHEFWVCCAWHAAMCMQAAAADYFAYSSHLSSWGFAVLQYDFNLLAAAGNAIIHTDVAEVWGCHSVRLGLLVPADRTRPC